MTPLRNWSVRGWCANDMEFYDSTTNPVYIFIYVYIYIYGLLLLYMI